MDGWMVGWAADMSYHLWDEEQLTSSVIGPSSSAGSYLLIDIYTPPLYPSSNFFWIPIHTS